MRLSAIQRHALHLLITRCNGVFSYGRGRAYAAANTLDALERKGLVVQVQFDLFAVSKRGRAEARPFRSGAATPPTPAQMPLPWASRLAG